MHQKYRLLVLALVVIVGLGVYWFVSRAPVQPSPVDSSVNSSTTDNKNTLPEGVEVTDLGNGEKLVKNVKDGYEVKVEGESIEKSPEGNLSLSLYSSSENQEYGFAECRVNIQRTLGDLKKLESEVENQCNHDTDCESYKIEKKDSNKRTWYRIVYFGEYVGAGLPQYVTEQDGVKFILYFSCDNEDFINNILKNFRISN